jgi:starvation-inducible DNA-binding protein
MNGRGVGQRANARAPRAKPGEGLARRSLVLGEKVRLESVRSLDGLLADTMAIRDLYKKHHWQSAGPSAYELHRLYDRHYREQAKLMDEIGERISVLGGDAFPHDVAEETEIPRPPREAEEPARQLIRLVRAHEIILGKAREAARTADELGDQGTLDLLASQVIRTNEMQAWQVGQQVRDVALTVTGESDELESRHAARRRLLGDADVETWRSH